MKILDVTLALALGVRYTVAQPEQPDSAAASATSLPHASLFKYFNETQCAPPSSHPPNPLPRHLESPINFIPDLQLDFLFPHDGEHVLPAQVATNSVGFEVTLTPGVHGGGSSADMVKDNEQFMFLAKANGAQICFQLDEGEPMCRPYFKPEGVGLPEFMEPGWHHMSMWVQDGSGLRIGGCKKDALTRFFIERDGVCEGEGECAPAPDTLCRSGCLNGAEQMSAKSSSEQSAQKKYPRAVIVTAANEDYADRVSNLIGSIHFWEQDRQIRVYDLGLSPMTRMLMEGWDNVKVVTPPADELPPHFLNAPLVAYKAWAILHAGQEEGRVEGDLVLWLDANSELRKPIDVVWEAIEKNDYFFTLAGHKFPTFRTIHEKTMEFLGCQEEPLVDEITSAIIGFKIGTTLQREILGKMNWCAMNLKKCHYPEGSTWQNQKRDQSALNCLLHMRARNLVVHRDPIFWAYATQKTLLPTEDEKESNSIVFFSRRGMPPQSYIEHILPNPPPTQKNEVQIDVHGSLNSI
ncbi:hypothetical protein TrST_g2342 [Triparma strigata]|uniref:Glycosyltransferase 2-like domain-containing protein n=1 Tax=Triparma strigata TaxID=1606541 RepID=A0A9W6ZNN3_9STRA|nr:hypothetical protein TrST_g2342 [Triparma strigata]